MFGDLPLAILDNNDQVQIYDQFSTFTIDSMLTDTQNQPVKVMLIEKGT